MKHKTDKRKGRLQLRFIIALVALAIVLQLSISILVAVVYRDNMEEMYTKTAFDAADIAADAVDGDLVKAYLLDFNSFVTAKYADYATLAAEKNPNGITFDKVVPTLLEYFNAKYEEDLWADEYYELLSEFAETKTSYKSFENYSEIAADLWYVKSTIDTKYCYVVFPYGDYKFYLFDAGPEDSEDICMLGEWEENYGNATEVLMGEFTNPEEENILITDDGGELYGYLASAYTAIKDSEGTPVALACIDISMDIINTRIKQFTLMISVISFVILIVFICVFYILIQKRLLSPIAKLEKATDTIVEKQAENTLNDFSVNLKTGDELEILGESFTNMAHTLQENINNLTNITKEKERIGAELDVAAHIQSSMLPCIFPAFPQRSEFDIYATMNPAKEVGGDFYDFFMIDERHLAIVVADVSGKGVPAALFMVIGKTLIKDHSQSNSNLGEVFTNVNNLLCDANSEGMFITAFEGVLDLVTGEFNFVNAGHEMPCICKKDGNFEPFKMRAGFVLAGMEGVNYKGGSLVLEPGDKIVQYTDGVTEATDANNKLFGMDRMVASLNNHKDENPQGILASLKKDIDAFVGDAPQFDDITMLCLEYKERMEQ